EVTRIRAAAEEGIIHRVELTVEVERLADGIATQHRLGHGESEVLALAIESRRALIDEGRAARVAAALGITAVSTLFLPVLGLQRGVLDEAAAISTLRTLAVVTGATAQAVLAIEAALKGEEP